jgi:hypothetical protein
VNEYSGLNERQLEMAMQEAEEDNDWQAMSKIQVADQQESFAGMTVRHQSSFIDRR